MYSQGRLNAEVGKEIEMKPTASQICKFMSYVRDLEMWYWTHAGDQKPDPDLVAVNDWLTDEGKEDLHFSAR